MPRLGGVICNVALLGVIVFWILLLNSELDGSSPSEHNAQDNGSASKSTPPVVNPIKEQEDAHTVQRLKHQIESLNLQIENLKQRLQLSGGEETPSPAIEEAKKLGAEVNSLTEKLEDSEKELSSVRKKLQKCKDVPGDSSQTGDEGENWRAKVPYAKPTLPQPSAIPRWTVAAQEAAVDPNAFTDAPPTPTPTDTPPEPEVYYEKPTRHPRDANIDVNPVEGTGSGVTNIVDADYTIPVLIFTYKRHDLLEKCLKKVFSVLPETGFRVFVSQDGNSFPDVTKVVRRFQAEHPTLISLVHVRDDSGATEEEKAQGWTPYYAISHHYAWAMAQIFTKVPSYDKLIILEEDLEVAGDFFSYMKRVGRLLDLDKSLYCISGWNDNGVPDRVKDIRALYRSDFFPGLGWMLTRRLWKELRSIWPKGFWDDWLRQPVHRKGRQCIRPEVPRSRTWCSTDGASGGEFCGTMERIKLPRSSVKWENANITHLVEPDYGRWMKGLVKSAKEVATQGAIDALPSNVQEVKMMYSSNDEFVVLANQFGIMNDFKDSVPRTAYKGIVTFRYNGRRVHLVSRTDLYE